MSDLKIILQESMNHSSENFLKSLYRTYKNVLFEDLCSAKETEEEILSRFWKIIFEKEDVIDDVSKGQSLVFDPKLLFSIGHHPNIFRQSDAVEIASCGFSDSFHNLLRLDVEAACLTHSRIDTTIDLSFVRPQGAEIKRDRRESKGVCGAAKRLKQIKENDSKHLKEKMLTITIDARHPDLLDLISDDYVTREEKIIISCDDEFFESVSKEMPYSQYFPVSKNGARKEYGVLPWNDFFSSITASRADSISFLKKEKSSSPDKADRTSYQFVPACNINLYAFVNNAFQSEASFDFDAFSREIAFAVKILDRIVDLEIDRLATLIDSLERNNEPDFLKEGETNLWKRILEKMKSQRKISLGTTGFLDLLFALGFSFEDNHVEEIIDFSEKLFGILAETAYRESVRLGREKGSCELSEDEQKSDFFKKLFEKSPDLKEEMKRYGRRNISCLSGTDFSFGSIFSQTLSDYGISGFSKLFENIPLDILDLGGVKNGSYLLKKEGKDHALIIHEPLLEWLLEKKYHIRKEFKTEDLEYLFSKSPYSICDDPWTFYEKIMPVWSIRQSWTDVPFSISIPAKNKSFRDRISEALGLAWGNKLKSLTLSSQNYEEGFVGDLLSRIELRDKNSDEKKIAIKRPRELEADVIRFQNKKERWIAFIGLLDGRPYEIFTGPADDEEGIPLPKTVTFGKIIKAYDENGLKHYDFQFKNKRGFKTTVEGLDGKFNPEYWNYAKLISGVLRYGMPIDQVIKLVEGLELDSENITTWKMGVERALKKYLPIKFTESGEL